MSTFDQLKDEIAIMLRDAWERVPRFFRSPSELMADYWINFYHKAPGWTGTVSLHAILFIFIFGIPSCTPEEPEKVIIPVEMMNISEIANIKPQKEQQTPKPEKKTEEKKPTPPKPKEKEPEPEPEEKKPEPKPEEKKPEPKPEPKKPEKKPEPKKPAPKKPEKKQDTKPTKKKFDFDSLDKQLIDNTPTSQKEQPKKANNSDTFDNTMPPSATEMGYLVRRIQENWSIVAGAKDADTIRVVVRFNLTPNGMVDGQPQIMDTGRYSSDPVFRAIADSAVRAISEGAPYNFLQPDRIRALGEISVTFTPEGAM